jgi:hypothetical protein
MQLLIVITSARLLSRKAKVLMDLSKELLGKPSTAITEGQNNERERNMHKQDKRIAGKRRITGVGIP